MRRRIAVGMLGLVMAGCAQSRSAMPVKGKPVGVDTPVPTLSDTINRGMGDPTVQRAALSNPSDPNWSGRFVPPGQGSHAVMATRPQAAPGGGASPPSAVVPEVRPSASSPPADISGGSAYGAGIPAAGPDSRGGQAPARLPVR